MAGDQQVWLGYGSFGLGIVTVENWFSRNEKHSAVYTPLTPVCCNVVFQHGECQPSEGRFVGSTA